MAVVIPAGMRVVKRGNRGYEEVKFDKITERIKYLCKGLAQTVTPVTVAIQTIQSLHDGITTEELDRISAHIAEGLKLTHPDYGVLAGRIYVSNLHKSTLDSFTACMDRVHAALDNMTPEFMKFMRDNSTALDKLIIHNNDYQYDYFAIKTLENSYLFKVEGKVCDRPQFMYMRVAIGLHMRNGIEAIKGCYKSLSNMTISHATPTLYNSGTKIGQLASCYLLGTEDSIEGIMHNVTNTSLISKAAGGIGIHMSNIRPQGALIRSTGGRACGIPRELVIYNAIAHCWDQGSRRLASIAIYLEPWHADIMSFLELKLQQGDGTEKARDLFYALWVPDLFVQRVKADGMWSLFGEYNCPGLTNVYDGMEICSICGQCRDGRILGPINGAHDSDKNNHQYTMRPVFTELYEKYEKEGRYMRQISARTIMEAIFKMQRESGTPYVLWKDSINRRNNQSNVGVIKSSNLCAEVVLVSNDKSYATCTLGSINVKMFYNGGKYEYDKLRDAVRQMVRNLDIIVDINKYPVPECVENAKQLRPIGIGIQGLADLFHMMRIPFLSPEAEKIDYAITETLYYAALEESSILAEKLGRYPMFDGSPAADGLLQFDLYKRSLEYIGENASVPFSGMYDWDALKARIMKSGLRNSKLIAYMPTVSTSQILGNCESFEPPTAMVYTKTTLAGKFTIANINMVRHLMELGLWNETLKNRITNNGGSILGLEEVPKNIQDIYLTVWEMPQSELARRSAIRSAFIDQSSSLNLHITNNSNTVLRSIFQNGHKLGCKTNSYYIRTRPAASAMKNNIAEMKAADTIDPDVCKPGCTSCSA